MLSKLLFILLMVLSGCMSVPTAVKTSFEELPDIIALTGLISYYHTENNKWPLKRADLNFKNDTVRLFLMNFDSLHFHLQSDTLIVDYKHSDNKTVLIPVEFLKSDSLEEIIIFYGMRIL